jgi:hypothetical protein
MKASLVAYDREELYKKSKLEIVKYRYVRSCPKRPETQIGSLEILGVKMKNTNNLNPHLHHKAEYWSFAPIT